MSTDDDVVIAAMERYGGSFVQALAVCYRRADYVNRDTLKHAFAEYWAEYAELAARPAWTGLMAGFTPAETDHTTTNSGDTGGPSLDIQKGVCHGTD